jgi:multidrug resistance efflux pump
MHTKAERAKSKKGRSIIVAAIGVLCILGLIAALRLSSPPTATSSAALNLTQLFILAPTNGVLTQILAGVGEHVDASAPLVQLGDPSYEIRVRVLRADIDSTRLALKEKQIVGLTTNRAATTAVGNTALKSQTQRRRDERAILDQTQRVRELTSSLVDLQAERVRLSARAPERLDNSNALEATDAGIASLQSVLDMARAELKRITNAAATGAKQESAPSRPSDYTYTEHRRFQYETDALKEKQIRLDAILEARERVAITVRAPFAGQIIRILHPTGTYVREGHPILILLRNQER